MRHTVAIVGRTNVGKSTLFNRILGRRAAIVAERPGVTRDRHWAEAEWAGRRFLLVDTGGIEERQDERLDRAVRRQADVAVGHADVIVLVADGRDGVHPVDSYVAELLHHSGRPVVLAVNKLDELGEAVAHLDFYELGLGEPTPLSALSGKGSGDLLDRIVDALPAVPARERIEDLPPHEQAGIAPAREEAESVPAPEGIERASVPEGTDALAAPAGSASGTAPAALESDEEIAIAVVGRPNVGKSSFVNRLLGRERVIVDKEAGTTRDAVDTTFHVEEGRRIRLIDTAGLRRRPRVADDVEFFARLRAASAISRADVCLLLVDAQAGVANQDFRIGQQALDAGKGLVFVANKWDLATDRGPSALASFERELRARAHYLVWVPSITCSAKTGQRVRKVIDLAIAAREARAQRIPTAEVNRVLRKLVARHQPPQGGRGDVRLFYGSQVASSPPLFALWSNQPRDLKENYLRYIAAGFREAWGFEGSPIRIKLKKRSENR